MCYTPEYKLLLGFWHYTNKERQDQVREQVGILSGAQLLAQGDCSDLDLVHQRVKDVVDK